MFTADLIYRSQVAWTQPSRRRTSRLSDTLPDDTRFYPGHGDDSTLGEQKPHLDEWCAHGW
jgi:glyoxylase-like metal-dependent hydrolase (beta-lactamase superfamily II)